MSMLLSKPENKWMIAMNLVETDLKKKLEIRTRDKQIKVLTASKQSFNPLTSIKYSLIVKRRWRE